MNLLSNLGEATDRRSPKQHLHINLFQVAVKEGGLVTKVVPCVLRP